MEKAVEVAAALIFENGRFLVGKRPAQKSNGNLWEFIGGKAEAGETLRQALVRECREELDVTVTVGEAFYELTHAYPDITVHLTLFYASIVQGQPKRKEHAELRWITPEEIPFYPFCPADNGILAKIQAVHGAPQAVKDVRAQLFSLREEAYRQFQGALLPTLPPGVVLGVRTPALRKYAKALAGTDTAKAFLAALPHAYFDENNLHAFLLEQGRDFDATMAEVETFLPYVDNWATCDQMSPKVFQKNLPALRKKAAEWLGSDRPYTVRYGIGLFMRYFLDEGFSFADAERIAAIKSDEYYVNMMIAWYLATALAKQYDAVFPLLQSGVLSDWVQNKTIQKAVESRRLTAEQKAELKKWKRKGRAT